ncbi:MAG TPA: hypothetical protein VD763_09885 [Candidatus Saccharimonadales bacterium]|nr:hypothetical protein [Candidatus Saccharimonadales bacterium]
MTDELRQTGTRPEDERASTEGVDAPLDPDLPGPTVEDAEAAPPAEDNTLLRTGTDAPDAADIEDPDRQM